MKKLSVFLVLLLLAVSAAHTEAATHSALSYQDSTGTRAQISAAGYNIGEIALSGYLQFNRPLNDDIWTYVTKMRAAYMPLKLGDVAFGVENELESASKPPAIGRATIATQIGFVKLRYAAAETSTSHIPQWSIHVNKKFTIDGLSMRVSGEGTRDLIPQKSAINGATLYLAVDIPKTHGLSAMTGFRKKWTGNAGPGDLNPVLGLRYDF